MDTEIYWIVKHGIKMTGMPAFGSTHTEEELWGLTVLAKKMPQIAPEQYRRQVEAAGGKEDKSQGHSHGEAESNNGYGHDELKGVLTQEQLKKLEAEGH